MEPERKTVIDGHKIDEFYWNRAMIVYVDNILTQQTFEEAVGALEHAAIAKTVRS